MNEELTFKIEDLLHLKEVAKIVKDSKENLIELLKILENEKIVKLNLEKEVGNVILDEKLNFYNLINVPGRFSKKNVLDLLAIDESNLVRIYKQSLYWIIVVENQELNEGLEKKMKNLNLEEDKILRYEINSAKNVKKNITKKVQHHSYMKEADDLGASHGSNYGRKDRKDSYTNKNDKLSTNSHSEAFSWRKKSDVSEGYNI